MAYILLFIGYLIGSIPFSIILGKLIKGIDIRQHGSGNPGTTNAMRVLGRKMGTVIFILDVLKGGSLIFLIQIGLLDGIDNLLHPLLYGLTAVIGHIYPVFLKFKGGKAVATSVGIFLFYAPLLGIIGLTGYVVGLKLTRYVSIGSTLGAFALLVTSISVFIFGPKEPSFWVYLLGPRGDIFLPLVSIIGVSFIFYRHRANFKRIINGTEPESQWLQKKEDRKA